jgi:hypothetical protein
VAIHHPRGDVMAITFSNTPPQGANWPSGTLNAAGNHWRAVWDDGVTEPGSSGGCLFSTTDRRCIGQLHGGPSFCGAAANQLNDLYGKFSVSWTGGGTNATRLSNWLDPVGGGTTLGMDGDPHITTADGTHYDFQGGGEYISLLDADGIEIQTRQAPISTTFNPGADPYDGLATCVSINSAVAVRAGAHRITIQPNLSGQPDPSGLQLRLDGVLTALGPSGASLGADGRVVPAGDGFEIDFANGTVLMVTPLFWTDQGKWYLNVDVFRPSGSSGIGGGAPGSLRLPAGIMGARAPGSWLPSLPNGASLGSMPASLHQRYLDLYQKFGESWRVTKETSLFDYAPGTSTETFTNRSWPLENPPCVVPESPPAKPLDRAIAVRLCRDVVDRKMRANCVFDVTVTGEPGFAKLYLTSQQIRARSTTTTLVDWKEPTKPEEAATFIATVSTLTRERGVRTGTVQFIVDGEKMGVFKLDANGRARWTTRSLKPGKHQVSANYIPGRGSALMRSSSLEKIHTVSDRY